MTSGSIYRSIYRLGAALLALGTVFPGAAQLHESISVEGRYIPEIIRVDRINMFPRAETFSLDSEPLDYERTGVAAAFIPSLLALPATGWRDTRHFQDNRGYLEFGAGSWLNSTLSAGYRFIDNRHTLVGIRLQHNSTSLWKPQMSEMAADVKQYRYDEAVGIYGSHVFKGLGRLDAAFDWHTGLFNYYGTDNREKAPTQTLNDVALRLDWQSAVRPATTLRWNASARVRHFAFRALPLPAEWGEVSAKGNRETTLGLAAGMNMPWDNGASVGLTANLDVMAYGGPKEIFLHASPGVTQQSLSRPDSYGLLTLTPYYSFTKGLLDLRIGADVDLSFNAGPDGNRYSFFHIAPDARFALQTGQFGMYLNLLGGTTPNTLASLYQRDYYLMPALASTRPTYTPLDAAFGVNLGPFSGFSIGLEARYRSSKNVPLGGWYQAWLNCDGAPLPAMDVTLAKGERMQYSLDADGISIKGYSLGASMTYEPSSALRLHAEGSWQPQKGEKGWFNGYDRPRVTARIEGSVRPIAPLGITVGYDYRGVRRIYTTSIFPIGIGGLETNLRQQEMYSLRLPDLTLLGVSASWDFSDTFSAWIQGDNLLGSHDEVLPMLPMQGLTVTGGIKFLF